MIAVADDTTTGDAYRKILRSASIREQSSSRMRDKLVCAGFSEEAIDAAMAQAVDAGIIDDHRYADALIRTSVSAGKGLNAVFREIEDLGVDVRDLDAYQEYAAEGEDAEIERALRFLQMHPPRSKRMCESAFRKLVGRGYESSVAMSAARRFCDDSAARPVSTS